MLFKIVLRRAVVETQVVRVSADSAEQATEMAVDGVARQIGGWDRDEGAVEVVSIDNLGTGKKPKVLGLAPTSREDWEKCPICGADRTLTCRCFRVDSTCANGHKWHQCVKHRVLVEGHSDHALSMDVCTCGKDA
jgi:hypothetical protein